MRGTEPIPTLCFFATNVVGFTLVGLVTILDCERNIEFGVILMCSSALGKVGS